MSRFVLSIGCIAACLTIATAAAQTERFDEKGASWSNTIFPDLRPSGDGTFERSPLGAGPNTNPPLPVNQGGDLEGRYFELSSAPTSSYAFMADTPANNLADVAVDGYVAIPGSGSRSVGFVVRSAATPAVNAYIAIVNYNGGATASFRIARITNNVIGPALATSMDFDDSLVLQNMRITFTARGTLLAARLAQVSVIAGAVVETPIDLLAAPGVQDTLLATDAALASGRIGFEAFARGPTSSVCFDDVSVSIPACARQVTFESQPLNTVYGTPAGDAPGDIIFTEDGIPVSVNRFMFTNGGGTFNSCRIASAFGGFGMGHVMSVNNINIGFDFSAVGGARRIRLDYIDQGGFENIQVNGAALFAGELTSAPSNIAPGVTLSAVRLPTGSRGVVTLEGPVTSFLIGGQEFGLDNICVERTSCPCDWDHDGVLNSQDFFAFVTEFFANNADFNADGTTNSQDFFDFLACFFADC